MSGVEIIALLKAIPKFVDFLRTAYADYIKMQIKQIEETNDKYIEGLQTEIAKLKGAKTDDEIAITIAAINRRR